MAQYTYKDMILRLTDMERLAKIPQKGERAGEQSSTDKRSRYDKEKERYVDWNANADADGIVRVQEDGGRVLAEMQGPGCLWRIWFGYLGREGKVKIYLDEGENPVIDFLPHEFFTEGTGPFSLSNLCYESTTGYNCYIPISYNSSCKIVGYGNFGAFYQFSYSKLEDGASVESFKFPLPKYEYEILLQTNNQLDPARLSLLEVKDCSKLHKSLSTLEKNMEQTVFETDVEGVITAIRMQPDCCSWEKLKELVVKIYWDQEVEPSVWSPFCDFFGGGCGKNDYISLPQGICEENLFYCNWYMPYQKGARLVLANDGGKAVSVECEIYTDKLNDNADSYLRFHAKWNRNQFQPKRKDRFPDYTLLKTKGSGRFVGCTLHVYKPADNRDMKCIPGEYWWGEGDEKFFIDGENFPSIFGTGTEDYFGFAWAWPDLFARPYHSQNFNQGGIHNRGNRSFTRFHISDDIPFFKEFEASIEKYYDEQYVRYAVTSYWYGEASQKDGYPMVPLKERTEYYVTDPESMMYKGPTESILPNSNFVTGNLHGWEIIRAEAFEEARVKESKWGNCFTYTTSSADENISELKSQPFVVKGDTIDFLLGGTWRRDSEGSFAALIREEDGVVLACSCCESEEMRRVIWDVRDYKGMICRFKIIDEGKGGIRSLSFTDLHVLW